MLEALNAGQTDMPHAYARIFGLYLSPGVVIVPIPWPKIALKYRLSLTQADLSWQTWLWFCIESLPSPSFCSPLVVVRRTVVQREMTPHCLSQRHPSWKQKSLPLVSVQLNLAMLIRQKNIAPWHFATMILFFIRRSCSVESVSDTHKSCTVKQFSGSPFDPSSDAHARS